MQVFFGKTKFIYREYKMKNLYAKVILYFYPCADSLCEQIDELVEKKALISMRDFSPCEEQCLKILNLTLQKDRICALKAAAEKALSVFGKDALVLLDYKYFKSMPKDAYAGYDFSERKYFRRQKSILKRFAELMDKAGINDETFERDYLSIEFFSELKRREEKRSISYDKKNKFAAKNKTEGDPPVAAKKFGQSDAMSA